MKYLVLILLIISSVTFAKADVGKRIAPNNNKILYKGALFVKKDNDRAILSRHNSAFFKQTKTLVNPAKAYTQSGVSIVFRTNSKRFKASFEKRKDAIQRQLVFAIYRNGEFVTNTNKLSFTIENAVGADYIDWEIVLPSMYGMNFLGLEIDEGSKLKKFRKQKQAIYLAIGNSITHGTGQKGHARFSYPFLLSRANGWDMYNLAVGGSKISWPVADMTKNIKADIITILWGFNDWNSPLDLEKDIIPNYEKLLVELRKVQPKAKIYCILPTTSKKTEPNSGDDSLDDIRNAERAIAQNLQSSGDSKLFILEGQMMTTEDDLNDVVHFSVEGANRFYQKLAQLVNLP